jgi:hypothetical protein
MQMEIPNLVIPDLKNCMNSWRISEHSRAGKAPFADAAAALKTIQFRTAMALRPCAIRK